MGVYIGQSTRFMTAKPAKCTYGRVPAGSVVVAGNCLVTMASTA
jgi:tetrahydrodipicolinate N-succinyltransferase